ncbi:MAG: transglycosylase domain-containing protein, partial [Bacteroidales bacterium]|nr:transglycosylase domain-containing protein [Bacteroidales bacterium]
MHRFFKIVLDLFLRHKYIYSILIILFIFYAFCLPKQLFNDPVSTVITDSENKLLGAKIADDGQWRFPHSDSIPDNFQKALVCFEDRYFFRHPGINPVSLARAFYLNIKYRKVVSGGSTISMQVIRLSRKNKSRTVKEKIIEIVLATRLELKYSKEEILALYASNAPFGGNVVGLEAASWRYFQRSSHELSWAESATLAVLPNAPSLIFPGKNKEALLKKRNYLLTKMLTQGIIDTSTMEFAMLEPLPEKPYPLPQHAYHLLMELYKGSGNSKITHTTINSNLQKSVNRIVNYHAKDLKANEIHNIAAIVAEVKTGNVVAYVGNINYTDNSKHGNKVNIITSPRS